MNTFRQYLFPLPPSLPPTPTPHPALLPHSFPLYPSPSPVQTTFPHPTMQSPTAPHTPSGTLPSSSSGTGSPRLSVPSSTWLILHHQAATSFYLFPCVCSLVARYLLVVRRTLLAPRFLIHYDVKEAPPLLCILRLK